MDSTAPLTANARSFWSNLEKENRKNPAPIIEQKKLNQPSELKPKIIPPTDFRKNAASQKDGAFDHRSSLIRGSNTHSPIGDGTENKTDIRETKQVARYSESAEQLEKDYHQLHDLHASLVGSLDKLTIALRRKESTITAQEAMIARQAEEIAMLRQKLGSYQSKGWGFGKPLNERSFYRGEVSPEEAKTLPNFTGQIAAYHLVQEGQQCLVLAKRINENQIIEVRTDEANIDAALESLGAKFLVTKEAGAVHPMQKGEPNLRKKDYFHGYLSSESAKSLLTRPEASPGTYLLRARAGQPYKQELCISYVKPDNSVLHQVINPKEFIESNFIENLRQFEQKQSLDKIVLRNGEVVDATCQEVEPYDTVKN